jgi:hypothetical protein
MTRRTTLPAAEPEIRKILNDSSSVLHDNHRDAHD